jgi:hypothetical protein
MRRLLPFLFAVILLSGEARSQQVITKPDLSYLKSMVGSYPVKYPSIGMLSTSEQKTNIWNDANLKDIFEKALGAERFSKLQKGWNNGPKVSKIVQFDDIIAFFACENHNCYNNNASIFINIKDNTLQSCWRELSDDQNAQDAGDVWLSSSSKPIFGLPASCDTEPLSRLYAINVKR